MDVKEKRANRIAIVAGSVMLMSSLIISSVLADIAEVYPNASVDSVQMVLTIPSLMGMLFAFIAGPLSIKFAQKNLLLGGMFLGLIGGVIAFFFGAKSLTILYISSLLIGINQGMNGALTKSLVSEFFDGQERNDMMGYQASSSTGGSMVITFFAAILAGIAWNYSYLILLLFIPALILVNKNLTYVAPTPLQKDDRTGTKDRLNGAVYFTAAIIFFTYLFLYTYQLNIAMFIKSTGLGNATVSGYVNTVFPITGMLTGFVFGKFRKVLGYKTIQLGLLVLAAGFMALNIFGTLPAAFFASFCTGVAQAFLISSCMLATSEYAPASLRATGISLAMGMLNLGMFCSPLVINRIFNAFGASEVAFKFMISAVGLILLAVAYTVLSPVFYKKKKENTENAPA